MKIYVFDSWRKFWSDGIEYWREKGHEVQTGIYWGPKHVDWCDVAVFHPVDNNLIQASKRITERNPKALVIAEAVDVDIYAGHPGAVNWEYVNHLVFMADHMRDYALGKFGRKIPIDQVKHVIPGGVNLNRFTMREEPQGYNVAWIGRYWIAKNLFGGLQVFHMLAKQDSTKSWRLHVRGDKYDPIWWQRHVQWYLDTNPWLAERVTIVPPQQDMNVWLEGMDFLLQTSFKEAFGYVIAEAAAKGIRPVIQNTTGALDIWPREWIFDTHDEAVAMFHQERDPPAVRAEIAERYPLERRMQAFDALM